MTRLLPLLLLALSAATAAGQTPPDPAPIRKTIESAVEKGTIPGAVVHVAVAGEPVLFEAFGDAAAGRKLTTDAIFRIASMTKPVTSVALMMLVEEGRLRLDDPLSNTLPEFAGQQVVAADGTLTDPQRAVTLRDLLTHTSGIAYGLSPPPPLKTAFAEAKVADGLNPHDPTLAANTGAVAAIPLAHQPGTAWLYGMSTDVLGRVVEVASGLPFDRFLADRVFGPLGMADTGFTVPAAKASRLVDLYTPGDGGRVRPVTEGTLTRGVPTVKPGRPLGEVKYFSGGGGLVSTARDYARFLQMLLNGGELDGVRVLKGETVRDMTRNQIGDIDCAYSVHGNKFGLGFAVSTDATYAPVGSYSWGGMYHTFFWVDPSRELTAVVMTQVWPWGKSTLWPDFRKAVYAAVGDAPKPAAKAKPEPEVPTVGRFVRDFPFVMDAAHGNPKTNGKFRVNDPLAALDPASRDRSEVRGNGLMQIETDVPLAQVRSAELALELWGGHPGTANKRVTVNGRTTYDIPEVGTAAGNCTHQYPTVKLERSDLVRGHNAVQFACDRGNSFWGHFIVESAKLRLELPATGDAVTKAGLAGFAAKVVATPAAGGFALTLGLTEQLRGKIARVDYFGLYDGFDENGDGRARDWHGAVKRGTPVGHIGTATAEPFTVGWVADGLPAQQGMAVKAVVHFADAPGLVFETAARTGLATPDRASAVRRFPAADLPTPFWSRADKAKHCAIPLDLDPASIASAELRVAVWDGGVEKIASPLTLNGKPLPFTSDAKHDVKLLRLAVDPKTLVKGENTFRVRSDTTHHGIEVLLPGPELWVTMVASPPEARTDADEQRRTAMNKPGDAKRGRELFASAKMQCAVCHKVKGEGGEAGPDLSLVAGKLDRTNLIEAVLEPSAAVLEGYRTAVVSLADGRTLTGLVSNETAAGLTLTDAQNQRHAVAAADVDRRDTSPESLMPQGLCGPLSPAEFTDLMAYLDTLRSGRKLQPGEGVTGALTLPPGFTVEPVAGGLTGATALAIAPDGRAFVCEQTGALRVVAGGKLLPEPFVTVPAASTWERGLIGVALDPKFPATPHVYALWVAAKPYPHHVLSRFTAAGNAAAAGSEVVLFEGDDQTTLGGHKIDGHQGGPLQFGPDGKLYLALGEQTAEKPSQDKSSLLGKVLRLNPDGSIPADNPFYSESKGKYRAVWALGCRNPFALAFQPGTGRLFINDVGGRSEEVNEGKAGANYGWPTADHGPTTNPAFTGPVHHYPTACITGGAFCPAASPWPAEHRGCYFFADFNHGFVRTLDPDNPAAAAPFATGIRRPTALAFAANGDLYALVRDAWVIDGRLTPNTGSLLRIRAK